MELLDRLTQGARAYALIALLAVLAVLPGFFSAPVLDRDEARFAQASRQMIETGDYVRINVQDEPRHKKPIGIHWAQVATVRATQPITGDLNTIWAYRLPSLLGVMLAALAAFWGGSVLVGRRAALIGACLLAATIALSTEGIIAKTDALLCGVTTLAMAALARLRERVTPGLRLAWLFWAMIGIGVLLKGPVTPMVAGLTLATLALWEQRVRWMAPLAHPIGPILALVIALPWFIAIQSATGGEFLREAFGEDLAPKMVGGAEGHAGPPGYHLALMAATFFPATIGLIPGLVLAWSAVRGSAKDGAQSGFRFLIAWAAPTWLVFEILPTKLPHYVLPALPGLALIAGAGLVAAEARTWRVSPLLSLLLFALGAVLLVALNAYGVMWMPGDGDAAQRRMIQAAAMGGAGALIIVGALFFVREAGARAALGIVFALAAMWSVRERVLPEARQLLISAESEAALRRAGLGDEPLLVIGYRETSLAFETRTDTHLAAYESAAEAIAAAPAGRMALIDCRVRDARFAPIGAPVEGLNYANGDEVCLQPGRLR